LELQSNDSNDQIMFAFDMLPLSLDDVDKDVPSRTIHSNPEKRLETWNDGGNIIELKP
jgi:hypothetical protein